MDELEFSHLIFKTTRNNSNHHVSFKHVDPEEFKPGHDEMKNVFFMNFKTAASLSAVLLCPSVLRSLVVNSRHLTPGTEGENLEQTQNNPGTFSDAPRGAGGTVVWV